MYTQSSNQKVLVKVAASTIHKISKIARTKLAEGSCTVYEQSGAHYIKVKNLIYNLKDLSFGQMRYSRSISYFFKGEEQVGLVYVLSILTDVNKEELIQQFRDVLSKYSPVHNLAIQSDSNQLIQRIHQAYPEFMTKQVKSKNAIVTVSKQLGSFIGSVSGMVVKPTNNKANDVSEKQSEMSENHQNSQNKQKMTESNQNDEKKKKTMTAKIGHKFNHSNNSIIRAVRQISLQTKNTLNEAYFNANMKKAKKQAPNDKNQEQTKMEMKGQQKIEQK